MDRICFSTHCPKVTEISIPRLLLALGSTQISLTQKKALERSVDLKKVLKTLLHILLVPIINRKSFAALNKDLGLITNLF